MGLLTDVLPGIAGHIVGAEGYRDKQMREYNERMEKLQKEAPSVVPTYQDIDSVGDFGKYAAETVGQFIPSLVTSIGGGGLGGFAAKKGAEYFGKKMAAEAAKDFAKKAMVRGQIGGAFVGSGVQTIPEAYATLKEETGDYKLGASLAVGTVNAMLDSVIPAIALSRMSSEARQEVSQNIVARLFQGTPTGSIWKRMGVQAAKGGIIEGLTEGTQEFTQLTAARVLDENPDFYESDDFVRMLDATLRGAIGGKAFGAAEGALLGQTKESQDAKETAEKYTKIEQNLNTLADSGVGEGDALQITKSEDVQQEGFTVIGQETNDTWEKLDPSEKKRRSGAILGNNWSALDTTEDIKSVIDTANQNIEKLEKTKNEIDAEISRTPKDSKRLKILQNRSNVQKNNIEKIQRDITKAQDEIDLRTETTSTTVLTPEQKQSAEKRTNAEQRINENQTSAIPTGEQINLKDETGKPTKFSIVSSKIKEVDGQPQYTPIVDKETGEAVRFDTEREAADWIREKQDTQGQGDRYKLVETETQEEIPVSYNVELGGRKFRDKNDPKARQKDINVAEANERIAETEGVPISTLAKRAITPTTSKFIPYRLGGYFSGRGDTTQDKVEEKIESDRIIPSDIKVGDEIDLYNSKGEEVKGTVEAVSKAGTLRVNVGEKSIIVPQDGAMDGLGSTVNIKNPDYRVMSEIGKAKGQRKRVSDMTLEELDALEQNINKRVDDMQRLADQDPNNKQIENVRMQAQYDLNAIRHRREGKGIPLSTESEKIERQAQELQDAKAFINEEIEKIEAKGDQGKIIADELREVIYGRLADPNDQGVTVGMALFAFRSAEIINNILPQSADVSLNFLSTLKHNDGTYKEGSYNPSATDNSTGGLMRLAFITSQYNPSSKQFELDFRPEVLLETASHEAFHVLQQYYEMHDPKVAEILENEFGGDGQIVDYTKTKAFKWIKRYAPQLHQDLVNMSKSTLTKEQVDANNRLPNPVVYPLNSDGVAIQGVEGKELAAYAFSAYNNAKNKGQTPVMAGGVTRFFDFARKFMLRLGNMLRGLGFTTADDVFEGVSSGASAVVLNGQPLQTNTTGESYSSRGHPLDMVEMIDLNDEIYSGRQRFNPRNENEPHRQPDDKFDAVLLPTGTRVLGKAKGSDGTKYPIVLQNGDQYQELMDDGSKKQKGFGLRHVLFTHSNDFIQYTPHKDPSKSQTTRAIDFIQDVISNGKQKYEISPQGQRQIKVTYGNDYFNYYGQSKDTNQRFEQLGWKRMGVVILREHNKTYVVQTAFPEYDRFAARRHDEAVKRSLAKQGINQQQLSRFFGEDTKTDLSGLSKVEKFKRTLPPKMADFEKRKKIGDLKRRTDLSEEEIRAMIKMIKLLPSSTVRYSGRGVAMPKNISGRVRDEDLFSARTSDPNPETQRLAEQYKSMMGIDKTPFNNAVDTVSPELSELFKVIANIQEGATHTPNSPQTKDSYKALVEETVAQYKMFGDLQIIPYEGEGEPYANSAEMMADVRDNNRLFFFMTENGFGEDTIGEIDFEHPLLEQSEFINSQGDPMLYNDLFRVVHDIFGHTQQGFSFGPLGEYNAFLEHSRMYSDSAVPALAAETLAQNVWFNYGKHLRREDGTLPLKGEEGFVPPSEREFSEQKAYAFPIEILKQDKDNGTMFSARGSSNPFPHVPLNESEGRIRRQEKRKADPKWQPGISNSPRNPRTEFRDEDGKLQWVVGKMTIQDWLEKTSNILSLADIQKARKWYPDANKVYRKYFGSEWPMHLAAWLMANQQASPSTAQMNALRALEKVLGQPKEGSGPKAGLAAKRLDAFIKYATKMGNYLEVSAGSQKLYDFVDAGLLRPTRRWMGDKKEGGAPFVADVHTMRDMGAIDKVLTKRLTEKFGTKSVARLEKTKDFGGSPSEAQYELTADFGRQISDYLNSINYDGGGWTPLQVQSVGWMATTEFLGQPGQTPEFAITNNIRKLFAELDFGTNAPYNERFPEFNELSNLGKKHVTKVIMDDIINFSKEFTGASVEKTRVHATGGWESVGANPSVRQELIATPEVAKDVANMIGLLAQQDAVLVSKIGKKTSKSKLGLMVYPRSGDVLANNTMMDIVWQSIWNKGLGMKKNKPIVYSDDKKKKNDPLMTGYSTEMVGTRTAMAIMPSSDMKFLGGKVLQERIENGDVYKAIKEVADDLNLDLVVKLIHHESELLTNDWGKDKDGQGYSRGLSKRYGAKRVEQRISDYKRSKLEPAIQKAIREAQDTYEGRQEKQITPEAFIEKSRQAKEKTPEQIIKELYDSPELYSSRSGFSQDSKYQQTDYVPKDMVSGYKLFEQEIATELLYPLFVDAKNPVPLGEFLRASEDVFRFTGKNGKKYVPARTGTYIPIASKKDEQAIKNAGIKINYGKGAKGNPYGAVLAVAYRPGWHGGDLPIADHLAEKSQRGKGFKRVWAKVTFPNDQKDYQALANETQDKDLKTMPWGGYYKFKTNPSNKDAWMISGQMRVDRVLTDQEVSNINAMPDEDTGVIYSSRNSFKVKDFEGNEKEISSFDLNYYYIEPTQEFYDQLDKSDFQKLSDTNLENLVNSDIETFPDYDLYDKDPEAYRQAENKQKALFLEYEARRKHHDDLRKETENIPDYIEGNVGYVKDMAYENASQTMYENPDKYGRPEGDFGILATDGVYFSTLETILTDPDANPQGLVFNYTKLKSRYSGRGSVQSFEDVFLSDDEGTLNSWFSSFKKIFPSKDKFVTEFINAMEVFGKLEEEVNFRLGRGRKRMLASEGAMRYIEMAMNTAGRNEMIFKHGIPVMNADGEISIQNGSKGLVEIFKPLTSATYRNFKQYVAARRADTLGSKEKFINQATINEWLRLETPEFKQMFEEYQTFNKGMLQFLVDSGVLTRQERDNLAKYDYIPFYREMEQERTGGQTSGLIKNDVLGPDASNVLNNPGANIIKKYSGGMQKIGDPIENIFRNAQAFISAGMKNKAMQKAHNLMERGNVGRTVTTKENANTVTFRVNGKKVYYDLSEDVQFYQALATMTPRQSRGALKLVENLTRIFREGVTHAPPFMIANLIRGEMAALVTVDAPLTPMVDTLKGVKNAFQESETIQEMKLLAGVGGYAWGDDYKDTASMIKRQMRARHRGYKIIDSPQAVIDLTKATWGQLTKVGEVSELATREAIYRKLREQGMSKMDAAYEALNVINFNRRGAATTASGVFFSSLMPLVPFLNARFQGLYRTFAPMITGKEANRASTIKKGIGLMSANLVLYALMSQDDRWREEPLHRRLAYHIIYPDILGLEGIFGKEPILIPRAFEVGAIFTTLPELFIDSVREKDGDIVAEGLTHTFVNTFSFNPIPQALIPALEAGTNYSFFRRRPLDSAAQQRYLPSSRIGATTPETARLLSVASQETLSPNQIQALINGYLGTLGGYLLTGMDVVLSATGAIPEKPTGIFGGSFGGQTLEALGFGRFRKPFPDPSNKFVNDFYELKSEVETIYSTVQRLAKDGKIEAAIDLQTDNIRKLSARKSLTKINNNMQKINSAIRQVKLSPNMSGEEKAKRLKFLIGQRNAVAKNVEKIIQYIKG